MYGADPDGGDIVTIFTLTSHHCGYLPLQIAAMKATAPAADIVVVQGPFGANPATSSGTIKVASLWADRAGVRVLDAPGHFAGLTIMDRVATICRWIADQHEGERLIVHGDLFPTRPFAMAGLLDGKAVAGRVWPSGKPTFTWLAMSSGAKMPAVADDSFRIWPATREGMIEQCAPCWMHFDKVGLTFVPHIGQMMPAKLAMARELVEQLGGMICDGAPCEQLEGLNEHRPRMLNPSTVTRPPEPIPEDFNPEQERQRMRQGGCCGAPARAIIA